MDKKVNLIKNYQYHFISSTINSKNQVGLIKAQYKKLAPLKHIDGLK
jgi:hypothetical protein